MERKSFENAFFGEIARFRGRRIDVECKYSVFKLLQCKHMGSFGL